MNSPNLQRCLAELRSLALATWHNRLRQVAIQTSSYFHFRELVDRSRKVQALF